eukprot:CAMPEP_0178982772 /NCGR_PEP_ID=MMETSP0795-20121207/686_1 /TAXON_ID=88552 /ORGANISM="Amoebophrya sp., Strain Ameob2" /LENGTH=68 /DNA_ID=CAMNT_0020673463 /DNA_START=88 /DNA_END=294 /DNA_ORIENTATION=+
MGGLKWIRKIVDTRGYHKFIRGLQWSSQNKIQSEWTYTVFTPRAAQKKVEQRVGEVMKGPDGKWGTGK